MLRCANYDIVFQEIPGEVTLAVSLSGCPNKCRGCHSPHLQEDIGNPLDDALLTSLLDRYGTAITCVCFMGGDADPAEVERLAGVIKEMTVGRLKTGWYSGRADFPENYRREAFDYIKLGPYIEHLGGLDCETTNQRLYKISEGEAIDITASFFKKNKAAI